MNTPLTKISIHYIRNHILQSILLVLGVSLGVAVVIAVDLANQSASYSFRISSESITGKATHRILGGASGFNEDLYSRLKTELGILRAAPVVTDYVNVVEFKNRPMQLMGIDPFAEKYFRSYFDSSDQDKFLDILTDFLSEPNSVLISEDVSRRYTLQLGSQLTLLYGNRSERVRIVGFLQANNEVSLEALNGLIVADISSAQNILNKVGRLDHIDLIIDEKISNVKDTPKTLQEYLPPGVRIERPETRNSAIEDMTNAFELNLFALSLLAIFVGVLLIYNIVSYSVLQRRSIIGTLRSLGVTNRQIINMIMIETMFLGGVGVIIGLVIGIFLGYGMLYLVFQTITDLYFTLTVQEFYISKMSLLKGSVIGLIACAFGALVPSLEAIRIPPIGALQRSALEQQLVRYIPAISLAGLFILTIGLTTLLLPIRIIEINLASIFVVLTGSVLLVPILARTFMSLLVPFSSRILGVLGRIAIRSIVRTLSRTGIAIAALMVAVSVMVSVDIMIGSFRFTLIDWLDKTVTADIFITPTTTNVSSKDGFDNSLVEIVRNIPGVQKVAAARSIQIDTKQYGLINLVAVTEDIAINRRFSWIHGEDKKLWQKIEDGHVLISEPFAYHNRISSSPGNIIDIPTDKGYREFEVIGIYNDYSSEIGAVIIADSIYRKYWDDNQISSIAVYNSDGSDLNGVIGNIQENLSTDHRLNVISNQGLKSSALKVFDRTFTVTNVLKLLAITVAFIGIFSSLMSLQLERSREIGVMRAIGFTATQIRRMILIETGMIGFCAGILALPLGLVLSLILVYVINLHSFGWTLDYLLRPEYFLKPLAVALIAGMSASIYPAFRFSTTKIASAIRQE